MRLVNNPLMNWKEMDGDTDVIKHLNGYLTCMFIWSGEVPSDECLTEANLMVYCKTKGDIRQDLIMWFGVGADMYGNVVELHMDENVLNKAIDDIATLLGIES